MKRILSIFILATAFLTSCKIDDTAQFNTNVKAELSVEFDNISGSADLQLNTGSYANAAGETFNVTKVKYYVSNFVVTTIDGTVYTVAQDSCYFLVDESDQKTHEPVLKVSEGSTKPSALFWGRQCKKYKRHHSACGRS